jgi:chromosome segregation ATPase
MADFLREGANGSALIRVTLLNEGSDAYQPEKFGKRIYVERKISRNGTSSYILLDHQKTVFFFFESIY